MLPHNDLLTEDEAAATLGLHSISLNLTASWGLIPAVVTAYRFRRSDLPAIARAFGRPLPAVAPESVA